MHNTDNKQFALTALKHSGFIGNPNKLKNLKNAHVAYIATNDKNTAFNCIEYFDYGSHAGHFIYSSNNQIPLILQQCRWIQTQNLNEISIQSERELPLIDYNRESKSISIYNLYQSLKSILYKYIVFGKNKNHGMIAFVENKEYDADIKCNRDGHRVYHYGMGSEDSGYDPDRNKCSGNCVVLTMSHELYDLICKKINGKTKPFNILKQILKICASYYDIRNNNLNEKIFLRPNLYFDDRNLRINNFNSYRVTNMYNMDGSEYNMKQFNKTFIDDTTSCIIM